MFSACMDSVNQNLCRCRRLALLACVVVLVVVCPSCFHAHVNTRHVLCRGGPFNILLIFLGSVRGTPARDIGACDLGFVFVFVSRLVLSVCCCFVVLFCFASLRFSVGLSVGGTQQHKNKKQICFLNVF